MRIAVPRPVLARAALAAVSLGTAACSIPAYRVHHTLLDPATRRLPERVLLLAPGVAVGWIRSDGAFQEMEAGSAVASATVEEALRDECEAKGTFQLVDLPDLAPEEAAILEEHLALFDLVGWNALAFPGSDMRAPDARAWRHRVERFDATIGPGLDFLAERTGAQAALVALGVTVLPWDDEGISKLLLGLVDLRTGDLLWLHHRIEQGSFFAPPPDLRDGEDAREAIEDLFEDYPRGRPGD
jgi:hypothetical protein